MTDINLDHCAFTVHPTPHNKLIDANDAHDDVAASTNDDDNDDDKPRANYIRRAGMSVLGSLTSQTVLRVLSPHSFQHRTHAHIQ